MARSWTDEQIVAALRDWVAIFGSPPIREDWVTADPEGLYPTAWTVSSHFGSWGAAIATAFPPKPVRQFWTKDKIIQALREWADEHDGLAPTGVELRNENRLPSEATILRYCDSLASAYRKAGIVPRPMGVNRKHIAKYLPLRREETSA